MGVSAVLVNPAELRELVAVERVGGLFSILDNSPDLPASAIVKHLRKPDMPIAAAEAVRATYAGMQPWVKAEEAKAAAEKEAAARAAMKPRRDAYEKSGREEPKAGGKVFSERTSRKA